MNSPFRTLHWKTFRLDRSFLAESFFKPHIDKCSMGKSIPTEDIHTKGMFGSCCTFIAQAVPWVPVPLSSDPHPTPPWQVIKTAWVKACQNTGFVGILSVRAAICCNSEVGSKSWLLQVFYQTSLIFAPAFWAPQKKARNAPWEVCTWTVTKQTGGEMAIVTPQLLSQAWTLM